MCHSQSSVHTNEQAYIVSPQKRNLVVQNVPEVSQIQMANDAEHRRQSGFFKSQHELLGTVFVTESSEQAYCLESSTPDLLTNYAASTQNRKLLDQCDSHQVNFNQLEPLPIDLINSHYEMTQHLPDQSKPSNSSLNSSKAPMVNSDVNFSTGSATPETLLLPAMNFQIHDKDSSLKPDVSPAFQW